MVAVAGTIETTAAVTDGFDMLISNLSTPRTVSGLGFWEFPIISNPSSTAILISFNTKS